MEGFSRPMALALMQRNATRNAETDVLVLSKVLRKTAQL